MVPVTETPTPTSSYSSYSYDALPPAVFPLPSPSSPGPIPAPPPDPGMPTRSPATPPPSQPLTSTLTPIAEPTLGGVLPPPSPLAPLPGSPREPPLVATGDSTPSSFCGDSCRWSADGACDDGGPGAQYTSCPFGSDCQDCGSRSPSPPPPPSPPPSPPPLPGPPPPPQPTAPPPLGPACSVCYDTCASSDNGVCEDGGVLYGFLPPGPPPNPPGYSSVADAVTAALDAATYDDGRRLQRAAGSPHHRVNVKRRLENGEAACENLGLDEAACDAVGCCEYSGGECWSSVGTADCEGGTAPVAGVAAVAGDTAVAGGVGSQQLCDDSCLYATDGACDDGGAGPHGVYGDSYGDQYCNYGTDCADCGPRDAADAQYYYSGYNTYNYAGMTCAFGTDCKDCGPRCPWPSPPPMPPEPPMEPPAAPPPPGRCDDSCVGFDGVAGTYANDGQCDDISTRAKLAECEPGTDCADCGVGIVVQLRAWHSSRGRSCSGRVASSTQRPHLPLCSLLRLPGTDCGARLYASCAPDTACFAAQLDDGNCDAECNTVGCAASTTTATRTHAPTLTLTQTRSQPQS